ncbi:MAG: hypothetical protein AAF720_05145 [Pseudomonadota bacterium]
MSSSPADAQSTTLPNPPLSFKTDYFGYSASVSPRVGFTDNLFLVPDGFEDEGLEKESEIIASTVFVGNAIYSAPRFTGIASALVDLSYLTDEDDFNVNQRVAGAGTFTLAENIAYFDVSGSSSRQLVGDNAPFSQNPNAARNLQTNVQTFAVSPYLSRQFSDNALGEIRYRFSQVFIDETAPNNLAGLLNDSRTQELSGSYNTGNKLGPLQLGVSAYGARTEEFGSSEALEFDFEQGTLLAEAAYALTSKFSLTGAIGVDEIRAESDTIGAEALNTFIPTEELSGFFWRAGFRYRPGRRTDILAEFTQRYGDEFINAVITYDVSSRLRFEARAGREFVTRAQTVGSQFGLAQRSVLEFANDLRLGNASSPEGVLQDAIRFNQRLNNAQVIGVGARNFAGATLVGFYDRTVFNLSVNYSDDEFGFRDIETIGGDMLVERRLSRKVTGYAGGFYRFADTSVDTGLCIENPAFFGIDTTLTGFNSTDVCTDLASVNGKTNTVGGRIGGRYQIYKNVSAFAEYLRTSRFSELDRLEFDENLVQAGFTLDF